MTWVAAGVMGMVVVVVVVAHAALSEALTKSRRLS
jgi:hypothetical protein